MDEMRPVEAEIGSDPQEPHHEAPPEIGTDERRMHVRAYNFWVSLLGARAYPSIEDLDPETSADFGPHSVLLDFTGGMENPAIAYLGASLRRECAMDHEIHSIADVPSRSLLSRLTDHYLQILANRAPIGFEAEFVSQRGLNTLYRGILMPFSSDDDTIDFVYGVINWKELAEPELTADLALEVEKALRPATPLAWADGPRAELDEVPEHGVLSFESIEDEAYEDQAREDEEHEDEVQGEHASLADIMAPVEDAALADHLAAARDHAEQAQGARLKSHKALYRALGLAHDFALVAAGRPEEYADLLADAGIRVQARAPMTAVIRLIFGDNADKARTTEFAAVLAHASRIGLEEGALADHLKRLPGGLKAMVASERAARKPAAAPPSHAEIARAALRKVEPQAWLDLPSDPGEFVLLLARRSEDGRLAVLAPVPEETALVDRAIRKITR